MGDVARCSVGKEKEYHNEELLYKLFGINAELLIDHAWGYETCTIADIKVYKPEAKSIGCGQVFFCLFLRKSKGGGHRCFYCKTAVPFPADGYTAAVYFRKKRKNSKKLFGEIVRIRLHGKKDSAS